MDVQGKVTTPYDQISLVHGLGSRSHKPVICKAAPEHHLPDLKIQSRESIGLKLGVVFVKAKFKDQSEAAP